MHMDKTLVCHGCGKDFVFSGGEQAFYADHGLLSEPRRCKECRAARKARPQESSQVICANCGTVTVVPFKPKRDRPVFCRECFRAMKNGRD